MDNSQTLTEVMTLPAAGGSVQALMTSVENTTNLFSTAGGRIASAPVPGLEGHRYIPWGEDNHLPYHIQRLIGDCEVTAQNIHFNVLTCYGAGLDWHDRATGKPVRSEELTRFSERNFLPSFLLEQMTDLKYYFFSVCVIILSRDGSRINRIVHKDASYCRLQEADAKGRIHNIYYANWEEDATGGVERLPLLDTGDPLGDLMRRMGREPGADGRKAGRTRQRKFAMLLRFPTVGNRYYPKPYYASIFRGGSYDEIQLISAAKRAKLRNFTSIKYLVRIDRDYWARICREENITDPEARKKRIKEEKEHIRDFLSEVENSDKVWISGCYVNPDGREVKDVQIETVSRNREGGDWTEDVQSAVNTVCYAFNIHPNLVGSVPGKTQTNNSGSDKRELFTMKQALEAAAHDILLKSLSVVSQYNGWDATPAVDMIMLTTLDQHRDAQRINPAQNEEP